MYWIRYYNSFHDGYNCTEGGEGGKMTEEIKQKLRVINTGRKIIMSEEGKQNIREAQKKRRGIPLSNEQKMKLSQSAKGRVFTAEHCKNISQSRKGKPFTNEHKKNLSLAKKEKPTKIPSEETRRKMSQWQIGKIISEDTRRKMKDAAVKRWSAKIFGTKVPQDRVVIHAERLVSND
jgi:NUMOD3 motif